jgi:hypothetical protein
MVRLQDHSDMQPDARGLPCNKIVSPQPALKPEQHVENWPKQFEIASRMRPVKIVGRDGQIP